MSLEAYRHVVAAAVARGEVAVAEKEEVKKPWVIKENTIRAVDFYSGIGGNHFALDAACERLGITPHVVQNVEVNDLANRTYKENFPKTKIRQTSIQGVKVAELVRAKADLWLASPPCQPFCRVGLGLGKADARTDSLYHLLECLEAMHHTQRPGMIFIENVKNFELSATHYDLFTTLSVLGYSTKEYLINPMQCGVPNSRLRYYLIAKLRGCGQDGSVLPPAHAGLSSAPLRAYPPVPPTLREFLKDGAAPRGDLLLGSKQLCTPLAKLIDVAFPDTRGSNCFTKGYPKYVEGTGSTLCHGSPDKATVKAIIEAHADAGCPCEEGACSLLALKIRHFAPLEVAQLMCFPERFHFHADASLNQQYRLLGNSVCVAVVTDVLEELLRW